MCAERMLGYLRRRMACLALGGLVAISTAVAAEPQTRPADSATPATRAAEVVPATHPASGPATTQPHIVQFQPGVRINWTQRQVETDVTVVLREGLIELFACCPRQREYESIVRMEGRPTHLYQAMGLIGLTPGHPDRVDEQGKFVPATGDPVDIEVRYPGADGAIRQEPIEAWMELTAGGGSVARLPWVFAGSLPLEGGKGIASDLEGTVVAVVDFPTSLIALPEYHTDSNDELWLRPKTARIPPVGTKGQLIIRAAPLRLRLEAGGRVRIGERTITRAELARVIGERLSADAGLRVEIVVAAGVEDLEARSLVQMLRGMKVREQAIKIFAESGEKRPITP